MKFTTTSLILAGLFQADAFGSVQKVISNEEAAVDSSKNPIRKVVTLLQNLQKKVTEESEKDEVLYKKYMCYCKTSGNDLDASIAANDAKAPEVEAAINQAVAEKAQLDADLKKHKADRESAKAAMSEASALREKEAKAYGAEKTEADSNIAAITSAVSALEKGMAGAFLQTTAAQALKKIALQSTNIANDADRQTLIAFLQGSQGQGYVPQSGEITGILKEIGDDMAKGLADATSAENDSLANFDALMAAKTKEVQTLTSAIEEKSVRTGETAVSIAHMKNDLSDTQAALLEDKKFLADLQSGCGTKEAEWDEISKTRAEELVAISETIKILNDDDALELFKKTLPSASSASLVQMQSSMSKMRARALEIVRVARKNAPAGARQRLDFISLALHGKQQGFEKVIKMIDNMVVMLKQEQTDDDGKKEYCAKELDAADDTKKGLEQSIADSESAIEEADEAMANLKSEIKALEEGISALDKSVAEATENRKSEHDDYVSLIADNSQAKELLGFAKNRLNKFYNPKLYVTPPKRDLEEAALVQVSAHNIDAPPPAPEAVGAYSKKGEETSGVITMIDMLIKDLDKEMQESEVNEKDAQSEYEQMTGDAADKRATDSASVAAKENTKADTEVALQSHKDAKASATNELSGTVEYIGSLHGECDWLMQYFDVRKEARASEVEALANAKAVLNGADFSMLVQLNTRLRGAARA